MKTAPALPEYRFDILRTEDELRALAPEWTRLYAQSAPRNPFISHEWTVACRNHICPDARLFVLTARAEGRLVGIAPLRVERQMGFRVLRFLGSGVSPYTGFLCAPERPDVEDALLRGLEEHRREWDLLQLGQLAEPFTRLHRAALPSALRGVARPTPWRGASYVAHDGDWETLRRAGLSWLKEGHRKVARFEREGGTVERYLGSEAADCVEMIEQVEAHSWQGSYGHTQALPVRRRLICLIREALATLDSRCEMELWLARVGEEPVAYEINFLLPDRLWLYRGAYHQDYARLSPGVVLDYLSIRQAWQEGRREYDYMSGGEPYKAQRTNAVRPLRQLFVHPATPRGSLAFALLAGPRLLLDRSAPTRAAVRFCARLKKSPRSLLPGSGVVRSRVH